MNGVSPKKLNKRDALKTGAPAGDHGCGKPWMGL